MDWFIEHFCLFHTGQISNTLKICKPHYCGWEALGLPALKVLISFHCLFILKSRVHFLRETLKYYCIHLNNILVKFSMLDWVHLQQNVSYSCKPVLRGKNLNEKGNCFFVLGFYFPSDCSLVVELCVKRRAGHNFIQRNDTGFFCWYFFHAGKNVCEQS